MPELPEVEVTRLSFASRIAGAKIANVAMGKALRWPLGCSPDSLQGLAVLGVRRRGKYLLMDLNEGLVLWHLGMSGSLSFTPTANNVVAISQPQTHDHFDLLTTHGLLRLNDPRRFGAVVYADSETSATAQKLLGHLGVEPLAGQFDLDTFHKNLKQRSAVIKKVLLAGDIEPPAQEKIARDLPAIDFDVIKVAHHGSRYQSSDFASWANAEVAFISVGKDNDYGHPAPETISLYELTGSQVFRTDLMGDLAISVQDSQIRVATRR